MQRRISMIILAALTMTSCAAWADSDLPVVYRHQWSLTASPNGGVRLDLDSQDIQMRVRPGKTVAVTVTVRGDADDRAKLIDRYVPTVRTQGQDVIIRSPQNHARRWFSFNRRSRALVEVALPPGMKVDFKLDSGDFSFNGESDRAPLAGRADSGDIEVRSASRIIDLNADSGDVRVTLSQPAERAALSADSGDVRFAGGAKQLDIHADSGDIFASGQTGDATIDADSGDIRVMDLGGSLRANADSGDVTARWRRLPPNARIDIRTDSGDVSAALPADARLSGRVTTEGGSLDSDFAGRFNTKRTRLDLPGRQGAASVRIRTESGDVNLHKSL